MNLLITGAWAQAQAYIPRIAAMGHEVRFLQFEKDALPCGAEWPEGIIGNGIFLSHPIEQFASLRYIQLTSAGFDRVPMDYVREKNITIHNARGVYSIPMAEYALAGVLQLYKKSGFFATNQQAHKWEKERNIRELFGRRVCVFGCGSVGTECAKRFQAMGCTVVGIDPVVKENDCFTAIDTPERMKDALAAADVVIVTLPLTEETKGMFDRDAFGAMKKDAVFVNIARGPLVNTKDLAAWLDAGGSAVLDVFEEEPLGEHSELWDRENVIITPHNSFIGEGNGKRLSDVIMRQLEAYGLQG